MNWGHWIIVAFVAFAGFIGMLVVVCMRQEIHLVSRDYYSQELAYQEQIVRVNNANQLDAKPSIQKTDTFLSIEFYHFDKIENGTLRLFSPADPRNDRIYPLKASEKTTHLIPIGDVANGMYRAKMEWKMNGKEYFIEAVVIL